MKNKIDVSLTKIGVLRLFEIFTPLSFSRIYVNNNKKTIKMTINDSTKEQDVLDFINKQSCMNNFRLVKTGDENRA